MSVQTISLGCRLNFAEAETIGRSMPADEDWTIVNSCAVTNEAIRQTRQAIRRAKRDRPDAKILVTGCAAELDPAAFAAIAGVTRVVGNRDKLHPRLWDQQGAHPEPVEGRAFAAANEDTLRQAQGERGEVTDVMAPVASGLQSHIKAYVAVQTGCDHRCTFCSIWQARGESRSFAFAGVRDAIAREIDRGAREIVLTGVDITDVEGGLGTLCQRLLAAEPRLQRLRLSSLDSIEIDDALFELIAGEPRLMPHFHLSLQAGDDMVLKRMKRRHSRAQAVATVDRIRSARADSTIGADLIAGFPTETEEMSVNSLKLLDDCDIVSAHIFPFSPRPGTPAAQMPQVDRTIVKARAARLRERAAERRTHWLDSLIGTALPVLVEGDGLGHSDNFAPVAIAGAKRGDSGNARIIARAGGQLTAQWA